MHAKVEGELVVWKSTSYDVAKHVVNKIVCDIQN